MSGESPTEVRNMTQVTIVTATMKYGHEQGRQRNKGKQLEAGEWAKNK